jgi:uncharacterized membrane protein
MVLFHLCYDLVYLAGVPLPWFASPLVDVWRASISWGFLLIAGLMCPLSRDNLRRGLRYLAVALLIYVVTSLAAVDVAISFGIIFCMGASTLVEWALERVGLPPRGWVAAALLALSFCCLLGLGQGTVGIGPLRLALPRVLYSTDALSWLGLPGPTFSSGDYYPLLPYCLLYLAGTALGRVWLAGDETPGWCSALHAAPLEWVGRHALAIYVIHQPVLLLLTGVAL